MNPLARWPQGAVRAARHRRQPRPRVATPPARANAWRRAPTPASSSRSPSWAASRPARPSRRSRPTATPSCVPPEIIGPGEHYALEVRGDSMIEAAIFDGDTVLIKKQEAPAPARSSSPSSTTRKPPSSACAARATRVALEAANPAYETRILPARPGGRCRAASWACSASTAASVSPHRASTGPAASPAFFSF